MMAYVNKKGMQNLTYYKIVLILNTLLHNTSQTSVRN
jgi:hypothetical protein